MDGTDEKIIAILRRDARSSHANIASNLGVTRATIRARIDKMEARGDIIGYRVQLKNDVLSHPVRALTMLGIEGPGIDKIVNRLGGMPSVQAVHSTNGKWDLVVQTGTQTLEDLDHVLVQIRNLSGIVRSDTSILLATRSTHA